MFLAFFRNWTLLSPSLSNAPLDLAVAVGADSCRLGGGGLRMGVVAASSLGGGGGGPLWGRTLLLRVTALDDLLQGFLDINNIMISTVCNNVL